MKNRVSINQQELTYYEWGTGDIVLFLHGGRLRVLNHKPLLEKLALKFHIIAPDLPGYGESPSPNNVWNYQDYALLMDQFLTRLGVNKVMVVGYSFGGGVAYHFAANSSKVMSLVLIDAAGIEAPKGTELGRDWWRFLFYLWHPQYLLTFINLIKAFYYHRFLHFKSYGRNQKIRNNLWHSASYLKDLKTPTTIIWAKNDDIFPVNIARRLNETMPSSKLVLVDGNHDWVLYDEKRLISLLTNDFLL